MQDSQSKVSIASWLKEGRDSLKTFSESPDIDLEYILCDVLQKERSFFFTWPDYCLTENELAAANKNLSRRLAGEPVAHIIGERDFWSLGLYCDASTLIPRPDTEILVEGILRLDLKKRTRILDLGTGTGAIALALASERSDFQIDAVDRSAPAVALATKNRQRHQLANVAIFESDWFSAVSGRYDLIVSNPPYIDETDPHLNEGDLRFEPHSALVAKDKGLADISKITRCARDYLYPSGQLLVEHGWQQKQSVFDIFSASGYRGMACWQDYGGNDRATIATLS